ncbi:hypothetical protein Tco_0906066 [Tanacetum coccineum]
MEGRRSDGKLPLKRFDLRLRTLNASSSPRVPDGIGPERQQSGKSNNRETRALSALSKIEKTDFMIKFTHCEAYGDSVRRFSLLLMEQKTKIQFKYSASGMIIMFRNSNTQRAIVHVSEFLTDNEELQRTHLRQGSPRDGFMHD